MTVPTIPRTAWGQGLKAGFATMDAVRSSHETAILWGKAWWEGYQACGMEWRKAIWGPNPIEAEIEEGFRKLSDLKKYKGRLCDGGCGRPASLPKRFCVPCQKYLEECER